MPSSLQQWRVAAASAVGSSHRSTELPNQDACWTEVITDAAGQQALVMVVADGAGSAARADLGAETAVDAVGSAAARWWLDAGRGALDKHVLTTLVECGALALTQLALDLECAARELSCTLLLTVVTPQACGFAQLGDGVMVYADPLATENTVEVAFWPLAGEYANVTEFLSDSNWNQHLRCRVLTVAPRQLALSSDGLQRLALRLAEQRVHAPFFQPFWDALVNASAAEYSQYSVHLRDWLASALVEQRTDDDKTLILAVALPCPDA
jgi:hypothetical protein